MNKKALITKAPRLAQRVFEDRMLVITVQNSKLHRFNEGGTFIWRLLDEPQSVVEISEKV
jgi:hypothetical protein